MCILYIYTSYGTYNARYNIAMQVIKAAAASRGIFSIFVENQTQNIA